MSLNKECKISASLMCADPYILDKYMTTFENAHIDYLHIDIMDGHFVPNYGLSLDFINKIREKTNIPFDFHLMIEEPQKLIPKLNLRDKDIVSIHYESTYYINQTIDMLNNYESKLFIALKPKTPISILDNLLPVIDGINFLTVNPGFAGQKIIQSSYEKMNKLVSYLNTNSHKNIEIEIDGNMTPDNIKIFKELGATIFVAGTSSIFGQNNPELSLKTIQSILNEKQEIS